MQYTVRVRFHSKIYMFETPSIEDEIIKNIGIRPDGGGYDYRTNICEIEWERQREHNAALIYKRLVAFKKASRRRFVIELYDSSPELLATCGKMTVKNPQDMFWK